MRRVPSRIPVRIDKLSAASQRSYGIPGYWEDRDCLCRSCGAVFHFTAEQQRDWYEAQQRHVSEHPVLCSRCFLDRRQRRVKKGRMDFALRHLKKSPTDQAKLEAAETILQYFQAEKRGDIELALHLLRGLLRSEPANRRLLKLAHLAEALQGPSPPQDNGHRHTA